jgi:hypothetical protein
VGVSVFIVVLGDGMDMVLRLSAATSRCPVDRLRIGSGSIDDEGSGDAVGALSAAAADVLD